ncbi:glycosyltransferase family 4 protein [Streptantibioticus ferralitis]|uniref:Glycosyltransferase family 4 protein n=1 Tax=Streptantibioticus ferralitis TaxID=236510 RepID=A0ABT5YY77_9ACTN|nr:glycosyltransferase family 4 protein [Streptantibioticus ferralitis]MDF2256552.1 glycosyltransferase family 4 protein [Streptantibioticus ferralitis]
MISTQTPPYGPLHAVQVLGTTAGAHVSSLSGGLVARGVDVTVCGPADAVEAYGFAGTGVRFTPVEIGGKPGPRADALAVAALRAACAHADVVHAHGLYAGLLASLAVPAPRRPALVVSWHGSEPASGTRAGLLRLLERRVARAATVVLGTSSELVDQVRKLGARDARLAPVALPGPRIDPERPGADPECARQKRRAELGALGRPLLLAVGRLEPRKGYDLLLDAARYWRSLEPPPLVAIAGEGSCRPMLQRRIDAEDLPVRLLGRRDDIAELLAAADVVVLSSRWESRPLIAEEALHAGVPLVATAVGGIPELVGDAAALVPYGDSRAFAQVVTGLLADPDRRARLAAEGRTQAATWPSEDDTVAQVLSVYDELRAD